MTNERAVIGDNGIGGAAADQLKAFVERIERVDSDISDLREDRKEILKEAKGNGFDTKVLQAVIRRRAQDKAARDEFDALVELYEGIFA